MWGRAAGVCGCICTVRGDMWQGSRAMPMEVHQLRRHAGQGSKGLWMYLHCSGRHVAGQQGYANGGAPIEKICGAGQQCLWMYLHCLGRHVAGHQGYVNVGTPFEETCGAGQQGYVEVSAPIEEAYWAESGHCSMSSHSWMCIAGVGVALIVISVLAVVAVAIAAFAFWKARGRTSKFDRYFCQLYDDSPPNVPSIIHAFQSSAGSFPSSSTL